MILVTLGTQDKSFVRLLKAIDREIKKGNIKEKVIVQAGYTKYNSKNMEIFDLTTPDEIDKLMKEARIIISMFFVFRKSSRSYHWFIIF